MVSKEMSMAVKILGLLGAIFVLIAQFVPWGSGAFLFGADYGSILGWDIFYITTMSSGIGAAITFGAIMIVLFIINLIVLILAFLQFKNIAIKGTKKYLTLGIIATVEFILYIVAVSAAGGGIGAYGIGFIMILITMIMFYLTYGLGRAFGITVAPAGYQQPMYQQPPAQQPQVMYTSQQPPVQQTPPPVQQTPPPEQPQPPAPAQEPQPAKTTPAKTKAALKFCPACGAQLVPKSKFCPSCGKQL